MAFMLLIHHGTAPMPPSNEWDRLSDAEKNAVYAGYQAVNETPGVTPGQRLVPPEAATTVRVQGGEPVTSAGPVDGGDRSIAGYLFFDSDDLDAAIELAAKVPAARMGGAVEVRPIA